MRTSSFAPFFRFVKSVSGCAALAVIADIASAQTTINVDFNASDGTAGTYSGTAVAPDGGTVWNGLVIGAKAGPNPVPAFTSGTLLTSTGVATPVTLSLGNFRVYDALPGDNKPAAVATALMTDFAYQQTLGPNGPNSTFSIDNLNPAFSYDIYIYAQNGGYAGTATTFTISGNTKIATNAGDIPNFVENTNYLVFPGIVPTGTGTIFGTFNDFKPDDNAAFNGLQVVQVPEPTALSFLACAGLLALGRRRS